MPFVLGARDTILSPFIVGAKDKVLMPLIVRKQEIVFTRLNYTLYDSDYYN
jgi:hypothetical protein